MTVADAVNAPVADAVNCGRPGCGHVPRGVCQPAPCDLCGAPAAYGFLGVWLCLRCWLERAE